MRRLGMGLLAFFLLIPAAAAQEGEGGGLTPPPPEGAQPPAEAAPPEAPPPAPPPPPQNTAPPPGYGPQQPAPPPAYPQQQPAPQQPGYAMAPSDPLIGPGEDPKDVRFIDANADRVVLFSTAETHPAGTFFFSDYQLLLLQFGYAVTDSIQIALTGTPPVIEDQPYFFDLSIKGNVVRSDQFRAAIIGSLDAVFADRDEAFGARVGGVGQLCFTSDCWSSLSFNLNAFVHDEIGEYLPVLGAMGLIGRISELFAFLVEPSYAFVVGDSDVAGVDGFLLTYGARLSGRHWGLDVAFLKPIGEDFDTGPFIMGIPWLSFTYRTEWEPRSGVAAPPPGAARPNLTAF